MNGNWVAAVEWYVLGIDGRKFRSWEEVTASGSNRTEAMADLERRLESDYEPGWNVLSLEREQPQVLIYSSSLR